MAIPQPTNRPAAKDGTGSSTARSTPVILAEEAFLDALCLERKRAERSQRRFVLMLIELGGSDNSQSAALEAVLVALSRSTRKTDIRGWYRARSIIGVIFTELGTADPQSVARVLLTKVTEAVSGMSGISRVRDIRISVHQFPEEDEEGEPPRPLDLAIYPDVVQDMRRHRIFRFYKRIMDIVGGSIALILFSPVMLLISVMIKLTSKGPVLFKQRRLGQFGRTFQFLKFRSMYSENDRSIHEQYVKRLISGAVETGECSKSQNGVYKLTCDPRVSLFGRFLRRSSLDELPQLINVLKGEMSIIGPRPPIPYEVQSYDVWHKARLLAVKPGITGLWQVQGRSRTTFAEMVRLDLEYARAWSLSLDLKILLRTPWAVLSGKGAY